MKKVLIYSLLLVAGLAGSQLLPSLVGDSYASFANVIRVLTMIGLSYIMIHVGYEFDIDKSNLRQYGVDYLIAFTAASFPWIFVTLYFVFVLLPPDAWGQLQAWKETLLAGRFAAPTSAGVLFSMLAAAGLGATWMFRKARVLAIFDDLDTVLLMIPLKMLMVGLAWQLGVIVFVMAALLAVAFVLLHRVRIPVSWPWVLGYAVAIALVSEVIYKGSMFIDDSVPIHIEVLLPAFVIGTIIAYPKSTDGGQADPHHGALESAAEKRATLIVSASFMVLVGLSMPVVLGGTEQHLPGTDPSMSATMPPTAAASAAKAGASDQIGTITASQPPMSAGVIAMHVLVVTLISNLGKMFPALCYRREAHWKERLAVAIGMFPRGEVGAGVLVVSISYGIGGPIVTIAMLSLALNLLLTGVFILIVRKLLEGVPVIQRQAGWVDSANPAKARPM